MSFHAVTRRCRSDARIIGKAEMRCAGSVATASSSTRKWSSMRVMVDASNRSVLYSKSHDRPSSTSAMSTVRSNFAVPGSNSISSSVSPGSSRRCLGAFWRMNITWKSGVWLRLRGTCRSAMIFSNGTSWWS